jgi:hypothetical protein
VVFAAPARLSSLRHCAPRLLRAIDSASGVLLLKTKTNDQLDWLKAGRGFARITLASRSSVSPRSPSAKSYRNTRKSPSCRQSSTRCSGFVSQRRSRWRSGSAGPTARTSPRDEIQTSLLTQPRLGRQSSSRRGLSSATNRAFRERSSSSRRIFLAACSSGPRVGAQVVVATAIGCSSSGREPVASQQAALRRHLIRDSTVSERSLMGSYRALHRDPWTGLSSHPGFVSVRALCAARARSHLGACLSDLVRKFAHAFGVRTQWPPRKRARVRPRRGTAAYRPYLCSAPASSA